MNKADLVKKVASKAEITQVLATKTIEAAFEAIKEALIQGESFTMPGFGTFKVTERPERKGRNPQTGAGITIPASRSARLVPGKALKEALKK